MPFCTATVMLDEVGNVPTASSMPSRSFAVKYLRLHAFAILLNSVTLSVGVYVYRTSLPNCCPRAGLRDRESSASLRRRANQVLRLCKLTMASECDIYGIVCFGASEPGHLAPPGMYCRPNHLRGSVPPVDCTIVSAISVSDRSG